MQVTKKNLTETNVQLVVVANQEQLKAAKEYALKQLSGDVKLPGFRPGKAPAHLVEKSLNQATLQSEFLDRAINALYIDAIEREKVRAVSQPQVKIKKFVPFDTLEVEFEVEAVGAITLPDYKKIKIAAKDVKVTAKDIEGVISELAKREAGTKDVDRAAKKGDKVWIDFKGVDTKTKEPIAGAEGKDYPLDLGSNTFIPGFEDEIIGLKSGSEKTFTITFPKDYGTKSLQNSKVDFTVSVKKVQELSTPKIDNVFAAKAGPFKDLAALKTDIKKQLESEQQQQNDRAFSDELLREITKKTKASIPAILIDEQIDRLLDEQKQSLIYRGQTWQEFLEDQKLTEEKYRDTLRPDAELRVRAGLVLGEVAEKEKVTITPEELEIRIQILKGQYPDKKMQEELNKPASRREIASRILTEKTIQKLKEFATAK